MPLTYCDYIALIIPISEKSDYFFTEYYHNSMLINHICAVHIKNAYPWAVLYIYYFICFCCCFERLSAMIHRERRLIKQRMVNEVRKCSFCACTDTGRFTFEENSMYESKNSTHEKYRSKWKYAVTPWIRSQYVQRVHCNRLQLIIACYYHHIVLDTVWLLGLCVIVFSHVF